jgi:hypothetical protein
MSDDSGTGLPAGLAAAWGLRERPMKGPRRALSLERFVDAAVQVPAAEGLPAVSIGRVAKELGSSPMSLLRRQGRAARLMLDAAYGVPAPLPAGILGRRAELSHWAGEMRDALHVTRWALALPVSGPPVTPDRIGWMERGLTALRGTGLKEQEKLSPRTSPRASPRPSRNAPRRRRPQGGRWPPTAP